MPLPPGILLGADLEVCERPPRLLVYEKGPWPYHHNRFREDMAWLCREGMPGYLERSNGEGICIQGAVAVDPDQGTAILVALQETGSTASTGPLGGDLLVAVPLRPGEEPRPDPPLPPGWAFQAPEKPDDIAGFAVFTGARDLIGGDPTVLNMPLGDAEFIGTTARITSVACSRADDTCTVKVRTSPGNTPCRLGVRHAVHYQSGDSETEWTYLEGTTDASGDLSWSLPVEFQYAGVGGRVWLEDVYLYLSLVSTSAHGSEQVDLCWWFIQTLHGATIEGDTCSE
jgi:hypothetical protein